MRGKVADYHLPFQVWGGVTCLSNISLLFSLDEPLPALGTPGVRRGNKWAKQSQDMVSERPTNLSSTLWLPAETLHTHRS